MKLSSTIDGPFFRKDPKRTFRQNIRDLMDKVVDEAERDVRAQLRSGESGRKPISAAAMGRVADHVIGRTSSLRGKRWLVTGVVSVNNSGFTKTQGTALMAAGASVESRVHAFRKTTSRLRKLRASTEAELLKGLT